jgi:hypothetical protein
MPTGTKGEKSPADVIGNAKIRMRCEASPGMATAGRGAI